ncbi:UNVERIFIED_ORG: hypothetical protein ABIC97_001183 [Peribacillus simplex]
MYGELTINLFLIRMGGEFHQWNTGLQYGKLMNTVFTMHLTIRCNNLYFMEENITLSRESVCLETKFIMQKGRKQQ